MKGIGFADAFSITTTKSATSNEHFRRRDYYVGSTYLWRERAEVDEMAALYPPKLTDMLFYHACLSKAFT